MRLLLAAVTIVALTSAASAKDVPMQVSDVDQQSFAVISPLFDQCVFGAAMRGEVAACRQIGEFLKAFGARVKAAADEQGKAEKAAEPAK